MIVELGRGGIIKSVFTGILIKLKDSLRGGEGYAAVAVEDWNNVLPWNSENALKIMIKFDSRLTRLVKISSANLSGELERSFDTLTTRTCELLRLQKGNEVFLLSQS